MFRIVLECSRFDCDKVLTNLLEMAKQMQNSGLLKHMPGGMKIPSFINASMITSLPEEQKIQLIGDGLAKEKGRVMPMIEQAIGAGFGRVQLRDFAISYVGQADCKVKIRLDIGEMDYDRAIDMLVEKVLQADHIPDVLQEQYEENITMENIGFYMHGQQDATKEYLVLKTMSVEKAGIMAMLENLAASKELVLNIKNIRFMLKN